MEKCIFGGGKWVEMGVKNCENRCESGKIIKNEWKLENTHGYAENWIFLPKNRCLKIPKTCFFIDKNFVPLA